MEQVDATPFQHGPDAESGSLRNLEIAQYQTSPGDASSSTNNPEVPLQSDAKDALCTSSAELESLDERSNKTSFLLGDTGESDPYLLRHFAADRIDWADATKVTSRLVGDDPYNWSNHPLVMSVADHSLYDHGEPRVDNDVLDAAHRQLESMCSEGVGLRLVKLFFRYVYPYFPILSRSQLLEPKSEAAHKIRALPLSLKASLYAAGLPFLVYDDVLATTLVHSPPSAQALYRIAWLAIGHEVHVPHLSTLQSCLLLLQRVNDDRYVMDTVFQWSLLGWTISLAQSLGLPTECKTWIGIPDWEKRLRRRLWWAVFVMDKWGFMSCGLASHIGKDDYDVSPLELQDLGPSAPPNELVCSTLSASEDRASNARTITTSNFHYLVELTIILSDIRDTFFTVRASARTHSNLSLSLDLAKPLRARLKSWKNKYDVYAASHPDVSSGATSQRLDGSASLGLAYLVATILLFRALLRPVEASSSSSPEDTPRILSGAEAVRVGAIACCKEAVDFVEGLKRNVWDAFWYSWCRAGFATVSSLMMRLLITAEAPDEIEALNSLIVRWRWALRTGGGSAGNVLMSLALLRLDRLLVTKGILEDDEEVI